MTRKAKVYAISTNKGGVLKTSLVTNFAGLLAKKGHRVLIIDTDNQGNSSVSFGENPDVFENTLYDVLIDGMNPKEAIVNIYENIDILPSNDDISFFEMDVISQPKQYKNPLTLMQQNMDSLKDLYDYILIDCPPHLGLLVGNVLIYSDEVIIPFQPETFSMRSLQKIIQQIESYKKEHNPDLKITGVIGTMVDRRTSLHTDVLQECRKYCLKKGITMFETVIPKSIRSANSVAYQRLPSTLTDKNNVLTDSYEELYKEVF